MTGRPGARAGGCRRLLGLQEVASRSGIDPAALLAYRRHGLLPPPDYIAGQPHYDVRVLRQLALITIAQGSGIRAAELAQLIPADEPSARIARERWAQLAQRRLAELQESQAVQAVQGCLDCRCMNLSRCPLIASGRASGVALPTDDR
jgi:MerR family transcriptional regulator, redox-sensitive transcriptional activator SoxR